MRGCAGYCINPYREEYNSYRKCLHTPAHTKNKNIAPAVETQLRAREKTEDYRMNNLKIEQQINETEKQLLDVMRYARWLEQQLYTSQSEQVFFDRLSRLKEVEEQRDALARQVVSLQVAVALAVLETGGCHEKAAV